MEVKGPQVLHCKSKVEWWQTNVQYHDGYSIKRTESILPYY